MIIKSIALPLLWLALPAMADPLPVCVLGDNFWQTPRSAQRILNDNTLRPCVEALLQSPTVSLIITTPDNDDASIEADELRQWLLALALPASRIQIQPEKSTQNIQLEVQQ